MTLYPKKIEDSLLNSRQALAGNSRPTGNKNDAKRKRLGPKDYIEHEKQILEKTQSEIFKDFKRKYPAIVIKQTAFENCKVLPFFVVPARPQDRNSCCCRQHVEIRMLFRSCMDYRRNIVSNEERSQQFKVYDSLNELVDETLCENQGNEFQSECLQRSCRHCVTKRFQLLQE